jgi:hypothetical protein
MKTLAIILLLTCSCSLPRRPAVVTQPAPRLLVMDSAQQMEAAQLVALPQTNGFTARFTIPGESVNLEWNPDPDADVYNVYYGTASHSYSQLIPTLKTGVTIHGLEWATRYYFAVTAAKWSGLESDFSDEFSCSNALTNLQVQASADLQSWSTCADCHPLGTNTDNSVNWFVPIETQPTEFYRLKADIVYDW